MSDQETRVTLSTGEYEFAYVTGYPAKNNLFESHCHFSFEIVFVLSGEVTILVENREYEMPHSGFVVIAPAIYHSIYAKKEEEYKRITVLFDQRSVPPEIYARFLSRIHANPLFGSKRVAPLIGHLREVLESSERENMYPLAASIMTQLFYAVAFGEESELGPSNVDKYLTAIIAYINEHITEKLSLDEIAAHVFLSKSTICHLFKSKMRTGIKQYILYKKIMYASKLMGNGIPAMEAAKAIGYENYTNFFTICKKVTGKIPSRFKTKENP